jgi:hypothetical protein
VRGRGARRSDGLSTAPVPRCRGRGPHHRVPV